MHIVVFVGSQLLINVSKFFHDCMRCINSSVIDIGSGNGLSPVRRQAITWTNAALLSIRPSGTNFSEKFESKYKTWIKIQNFSFAKLHLKCRLRIGDHFVRGGNELHPLLLLRTEYSGRTTVKPLILVAPKYAIKLLIIQMQLEHRLSALLQLHLHTWPNT